MESVSTTIINERPGMVINGAGYPCIVTRYYIGGVYTIAIYIKQPNDTWIRTNLTVLPMGYYYIEDEYYIS